MNAKTPQATRSKTATPHHDPHPDRARLDQEHRLDEDLEETFPASDAPSLGGSTKIGNDGKEKGSPRHKPNNKPNKS